MLCLDLLQCYLQRSVQRAWDQCLKLSVGSSQVYQMLKKQSIKESLLEICSFKKLISSFKKPSSVTWIRTHLFLPGVLVGSLLLSGCVTFSSSQSSAPSGQESNLLPSPLQKTKKPSSSSGDWLLSPQEQTLPPQLQRGTLLWYQSPLWER